MNEVLNSGALSLASLAVSVVILVLISLPLIWIKSSSSKPDILTMVESGTCEHPAVIITNNIIKRFRFIGTP